MINVVIGAAATILLLVVAQVWRARMAPSVLLIGASVGYYAAERMFPGGEAQSPLNSLATLTLLMHLIVRWREIGGSKDERQAASRLGLMFAGITTGSLLLYFGTTDAFATLAGWDEDTAAWWYVVLTAVWPIAWLCGVIPSVMIDWVLARNPVVLPIGAKNNAVQSGLIVAFTLAIVFPINYLAASHDQEWDFSYFRTARPGGPTRSIVRNLAEPVEAILFYSPANEVKEELVPYFETLARASGGQFTVRVVDQPMDPELAEELKIRDNGTIVLRQGEGMEKIRINDEMSRAQSQLKKLDGTVEKHLLKLVKGKRTAYMMVGHGEAASRGQDDVLYKLSAFKKLLQGQNYTVKDFGLDDGSSTAVPDDAALVILAAPEMALLESEEDVLKQYLDRGGSLLVMVDPGRDRLEGLLSHVGVTSTEGALAHPQYWLPLTRTLGNPSFLTTQRFGSHAVSSTLSKNSSQVGIYAPTALGLTAVEGHAAEVSKLVRTRPGTFEDLNGDYKQNPGEPEEEWSLAMASSGGEGETAWRAVVLGDVSLFSDIVLSVSKGNQILTVDATRWLVGDEELAGETNSEEDVKIQHSREGQEMWFYGVVFTPPGLVLLLGGFLVRVRRTS